MQSLSLKRGTKLSAVNKKGTLRRAADEMEPQRAAKTSQGVGTTSTAAPLLGNTQREGRRGLGKQTRRGVTGLKGKPVQLTSREPQGYLMDILGCLHMSKRL